MSYPDCYPIYLREKKYQNNTKMNDALIT